MKHFSKNRKTKILWGVPMIFGMAMIPLFEASAMISPTPNLMEEAMQAQQIRGKIVSSVDGLPLPGVTVLEKGTTNGTVTEIDGTFSINVSGPTSVLVFSYVGFDPQEITVGNQSSIDVTMSETATDMSEVVVTAFGIKRDQRSLGYDVSSVQGEELTQVSQENVLGSLAGRMPGVQINQTSGPGSSISMVIRGATSLTTDNQPLFVVDGIPMSNSLNNVRQNGDGNQVDYGNAISDISPDDIESISVLKGPSAAALYGTRAGNGVVIITTKSGSNNKALGVSFSTSNVFEQPTKLLDFHYKYANGNREGVFNEGSAYWGGPALNAGNTAIQWNSPLDADGNPIATELIAYPNAMRDFMQTGVTSSNNVSVDGGNDRGSFRASYSNMLNRGIIPGSDLYRNSFGTSLSYKITDKLTFNSNINYVNSKSNNRPSTGDRRANPLEAVYGSPYIDYEQMKDYWVEGQEGIQQVRTEQGDNPYFIALGIRNGFVRDRIYGNASLDYQFSESFNIRARYSLDRSDETLETKIPFSYSRMARGGYYVSDITTQESNADVLASWNKDFGKLDVNASVGGNIMNRHGFSTNVGVGSNRNNGLVIPGIFNVQNIPADNRSVSNSYYDRAIYSIYGLASFGYADQLYLDLTARNDWSSTLPRENRSYFYPSASLSWLANYTLGMSDEIDLFKFRFGWAQVGNDTGPYNLVPNLSTGTYNNINTASMQSGLLNPDLKPEQATSYEGGIDLHMFNNRVRFSGTYYVIDNRNQIFSVNLPASSGYTGRLINAGLIQSKGLELALGGTVLQKQDLTWDVNFNWSRNRTTVKELTEGLDRITLWSENGGGAITFVGEQIGDMYSRGFVQVEDPSSPYYKWPVLSNAGEWQRLSDAEDLRKVGNFNPDFMLGFQTTLNIKRFVISASIDWRQGGEFMSFTYRYGESDWKSQRQLDMLIPGSLYTTDELIAMMKANPDKYIIPTAGNFPRVGGHTAATGGYYIDENGNDGAFVPGVIQTAGQDTPDDYSDDVYEEHLGGEGTNFYPITDTYPWSFNEQVTFDATFIKLRELSLGYRLPNMGAFKNITFSVYTRNLMIWTKAQVGIDPERAFWANSGNQGNTSSQFRQGIERQNVMPWTAPVGFKLNFNL
ncbi:SusC/RagA family TonB-linked outer membrane protein [Algoriphagus zhangzhouensis]|uniref:TonB-linked outer membrane protein, SusC/RagA family n=1 Tax=Algoriphagus zhangzhouensis TaxID=1073327 RepID=A0A1M7Z7R3_9BACT|nr:SusC/RagA family TonB-linked outer membrane protein [Algoriphagus zhangzhouensis]TDY49437.1 TonB-linked SusC/RagA family outer membrane protein [Algoriphagus zhangzhouensis]SHO60941.1 TonB-linked outer membrane protein, SusC/RagA family [Algoriphagus zhangzhouensis]